MNFRHLATKSFDSDITIRRSIVYPGTHLSVGITHKAEQAGEPVKFSSVSSESVLPSIQTGMELMASSPIGEVVLKDKEMRPLSQCFGFEIASEDGVGVSFNDLIEMPEVQEPLRNMALEMFPDTNPNTHSEDVNAFDFFTPYIPLVVLTGCMTPQTHEGSTYFNPYGVVTIAEFLDGLNSINFGCNANNARRKSLDNVSTERDYFNEGYQSLIRGVSSPFFNLYTREELMTPITRLELAYLTVVCWSQFIEKFNNLYGGKYYLGVSFDWDAPQNILSMYEDGYSYRVSKISVDEVYEVVSLNVKDYRSDRSMSEYREDLLSGSAAIPLPMFMSMLELGALGLFEYEGGRLDPMREVSRGELCYFLSQLAKVFPTSYM